VPQDLIILLFTC